MRVILTLWSLVLEGHISPTVLFYNLRAKVPGEIATRDVVVFDEISKVRLTNSSEMMGKLRTIWRAVTMSVTIKEVYLRAR